jgi:hypothetical protein
MYLRYMEHIPFELNTSFGIIKGFLNRMDKTFPPGWFHVMETRVNGNYYCGQLLWINSNWHLPDSSLSTYAEVLGQRIQLWYESE